jgi:3-isopropylmalate/(R)-2-methylmalate dehydratase small subunit
MSTDTDVRTITEVSGTGVPVRGNDIDTDRVIPARFMKEVTFENMGEYAFYDARRTDDGEWNDHPFNRFTDANILIVNQNFGCGSSREHAPQALMRWGIEGVIGESFAEIFAGNCQALGIPTVTADTEDIHWIMQQVEEDPATEIRIDVVKQTVTVGDRTIAVNVNDSQKEALQQGNWDTTTLLKSSLDQVKETYDRLPYTSGFADS